MTKPPVRHRLGAIIDAGEAATCSIIDLEVLFSARSHRDWLDIRRRRALAYEHVEITPATFDRAIEVQGLLARSGKHRVSIPDLLIAAAAEDADLSVLHYDHDYDVIANATGQPTEWVVPRGTAD